jgi:hypothetical protein
MESGWNTANVWLTVIAIASVVQTTCVVIGMIYAARLTQRLSQTMASVEQMTQPLATRVGGAVDDVHRLIGRLEQTEALARNAIERASATADRVGVVLNHAKDMVRWRAWPLVGLVRGAGAALSTLAEPRRTKPRRDRLDEVAEARFGYEGGANARDVR